MRPKTREIKLGLSLSLDAQIVSVRDHSNHRHLLRMRTKDIHQNARSQRVFAGEITLDKCLIDDDEIRIALDVFLFKDPALLQFKAHRMEEIRADRADLFQRQRARGRGSCTCNEKSRHYMRCLQWNGDCRPSR